MLIIKSLFRLIASGCMLLTFFSSADAASFNFDKPYQGFDISLPLSFEDNGTTLNVSASTGYWRQSDFYTFPGLSGGVITNGLRLAGYPAETLTLQFNKQFSSFSANYAVAFENRQNTYYSLTLTAFLNNIIIDSYTIYQDSNGNYFDSGLFSFSPLNPFDRIVITTSSGMDLAIDNVVVIPLPGTLFLMLSAISWLLVLPKTGRIYFSGDQCGKTVIKEGAG